MSPFHHILIPVLLTVLISAVPAASMEPGTSGDRPEARAPQEPRGAWSGQLDELIATARALAAADDTAGFVWRPNIPYVVAHYAPEQLAADQIDTVLIINSRGKPLFWRRVNQGPNRGFSDAMTFLAELPLLPPPGAAGTPGIAGAAVLAHGPTLVVAMPIYDANGRGAARGWLITARVLAATQWHRHPGSAQFAGDTLDPTEMNLAGYVASGQQTAGAGAATFFSARSALWIILLIILTGVIAHSSGALGVWGDKVDRMRVTVRATEAMTVWAPPARAVRSDVALTQSSSSNRALAPPRLEFEAEQAGHSLQARLAAANAVVRFQPQTDLQTGCVAGVEALLCVPGQSGYRSAIGLVVELESAGFGLALFEHRLREACREQRGWLQEIGHEFAIGVPVSQRLLEDAHLLPLVLRVLAENQFAPSLLELEVEESALTVRTAPLRTLSKAHEAGISIAIDGFNAIHSNLRLLTILPVSKLRIDPWLLVRMGKRESEALMFDAILGAARAMGVVVCATGVDSPDLLSTVLRHGRPLAQGMAVGSPLESAEFLKLLRDANVDTASLPPLDLVALSQSEIDTETLPSLDLGAASQNESA
jgi:EAL domain-containing protein (putative c-di-GMP-specific phosphodiesterase class I)